MSRTQTRTGTRKAGRRRFARLAAVLAVVLAGALGALVLAAAPASAHDSLVSTAPTSGQTLPQIPASVVLTFDEPAVAMGTQILVTGPDGPVQQGTPQLVDDTVTQAVAGNAPAGRYTVDWRVTSADGHPVSGSFTFTTEAAGTRPRGAPPVTPSPFTDSGPGWWLWWLLAALVLAVAAALLVRWRRRRHDAAAPTRPPEEELTGGNSGVVVRAGDTVRRAAGPWSPAVQRLLATLRAAGLTEVPAPLGLDDQGRDVVSYLRGEVVNDPLPAWLWSEAILLDAAALLRRMHDASTELALEDLEWQLPGHRPVEVVCHNDVAPYNMVFQDERLVGLIDFDTASPGPRIWDFAYLAYRIVPLAEDALDGGPPLADRLHRLDALIEAYGSIFSSHQVLVTMADRLEDLARFTDRRATDTGRDDFVEHAAMYRRDRDRVLLLAEDRRPR